MKYLLLIGIFIVLMLVPANGQSLLHQQPMFLSTQDANQLEFRSSGVSLSSVSDAYFLFRYTGETNFKQIPATIDNSTVLVSFTPEADRGSELEYFLELEFIDGNRLTFPETSPRNNPVTVNIVEESSAEISGYSGIEYTILSPEPGTTITEDDAVIAIALFYENDNEEEYSLSILINDTDVSDDAFMSPYLITYEAERGTLAGFTTFSIIAEKDGESIEIVSWSATVTDRRRTVDSMLATDRRVAVSPIQTTTPWVPTGQVEVTARSQSFAGNDTEMARAGFRMSGRDGDIRYSINGNFTTQESSRLQPQNRYGAEIYVSNWLELQAGHIYPSLNPFLMSGRRMFGVNTELRALDNRLQFQFLYGAMSRAISPRYGDLSVQTITIQDQNGNPVTDANGNPVTDLIYTLPLEQNGFGTYRRDIAGFRIGAGNQRTFAWNLHAVRVEDDVNSINIFRNFNDLDNETLSSLTQAEREALEENIGALDIRRGAQAPMGNFAMATDFQFRFDEGRVRWRTDVAASLTNNDITRGVLTAQRAEELGFDIGDDALRAFDRWSWLIVINENMNSLPLQLQDGEASVFFPAGIFMGQTDLNLNYYGHNLNIMYRYIGPEFNSLASIGQRTDIQGYTITDRFRVANNTLFFTLGHEILWDNVTGTRDATTSAMTNRANISWYPMTPNTPNISVGVRHRIRNNNVDRVNPYLPQNLLNAAVRNAVLIADDIDILPTPRDNATLQLNAAITQPFEAFNQDHELSFNVAYLNTTDNVFEFGDFNSTSFGVQLLTNYSNVRMRTRFGGNMMFSESSGGLTTVDVMSITAGMDYRLLQNRLTLNLDAALTLNESKTIPLVTRTFTPANIDQLSAEQQLLLLYYAADDNQANFQESDNTTIFFSGGARYAINSNNDVILNFNYSSITSSFAGLDIPNDHMVQVRYVTNF